MKETGRRLRQLREDKKLSQLELGNIFNKSQSAIGKYENEALHLDSEMLKKYANFFNVTVDYLLAKDNHVSSNLDDSKSTLTLSDKAIENLKRASVERYTLNSFLESPSFLQLIIRMDLYIRSDFSKINSNNEKIKSMENKEMADAILSFVQGNKDFESEMLNNDLTAVCDIFNSTLKNIRKEYQQEYIDK
jgi:transcriptional regulator with XRE-family HTH domain